MNEKLLGVLGCLMEHMEADLTHHTTACECQKCIDMGFAEAAYNELLETMEGQHGG